MGTDKEPVAPVSAGSSPAVLSTVGAWGLGTSKLKASIWRARNRGGSPSVASVCLGRVKEYCPFKDWSTQMAPSSVVFFPPTTKNPNFSTLCLAECVLFCFKFV